MALKKPERTMTTTSAVSVAANYFSLAGSLPASVRSPTPRTSPSPLERLVQITRSNDHLIAELEEARRRFDQAVAYAGDSRSRSALGKALILHAQEKQARVLAQLRSNRTEALTILAQRATRP